MATTTTQVGVIGGVLKADLGNDRRSYLTMAEFPIVTDKPISVVPFKFGRNLQLVKACHRLSGHAYAVPYEQLPCDSCTYDEETEVLLVHINDNLTTLRRIAVFLCVQADMADQEPQSAAYYDANGQPVFQCREHLAHRVFPHLNEITDEFGVKHLVTHGDVKTKLDLELPSHLRQFLRIETQP
ncbi:unnamed protein product [Caenorhabditis bovis]|uniref:Uncharacterized protein n=1 Tax=Caenorhabditis bovis TaxID=2654633 RepID=A0A8S1F109_9PELO|nr:unnamed protein product [Caenorhabditis bovis]